jgi:hypothetical protein
VAAEGTAIPMPAPSERRAALSGRPEGGGSLLNKADLGSACPRVGSVRLPSDADAVAAEAAGDGGFALDEPRSRTLSPSLVPLITSRRRSARDLLSCATAAERPRSSGRRTRQGVRRSMMWVTLGGREFWGLTFELKPTTEVGGVRLDCDDARVPQASLTLPAVVGRRLERGVRPRLHVPP